MKKLLTMVLTLTLAFSFAGCGSDDKSKDDDKKFVVGFDAEYAPYGYRDAKTGEYVGFDLDIAQAVCEREGWELVKTPINWNSKDMELDSGSIDCIWNGFTINGRENDYEWSIPYVNNTQVIVVAEDSGIENLEDLSGKVVGVQAASAAESLFAANGSQYELSQTFEKLNPFKDYNTAFTELLAGSIDALAIDVGVANYQISTRGEGYKILKDSLNSEQYGVGFKLGNTELRDKINEDLKILYREGKITELAEKYGIDPTMICIEE